MICWLWQRSCFWGELSLSDVKLLQIHFEKLSSFLFAIPFIKSSRSATFCHLSSKSADRGNFINVWEATLKKKISWLQYLFSFGEKHDLPLKFFISIKFSGFAMTDITCERSEEICWLPLWYQVEFICIMLKRRLKFHYKSNAAFPPNIWKIRKQIVKVFSKQWL